MMLKWLSRASAVLLCAAAAIGCYSDPEDYCKSKVESLCNTVSTCCDKGTVFDMETCKLQSGAACMQQFRIDEVHAGSLVFDPGSADACIGSISSCDDLTKAQASTDERTRACANALTGFVPAGMACNNDSDCAHEGGDFATCYAGKICAMVVFSGDTCGFSVETNQLRTCQHGKYCDLDDKTIDPKQPPLAQTLESTGTCKDWIAKGKKCVTKDAQNQFALLPCADGLYCELDQMDPTASTCKARKSAGAACNDTSECKENLYCAPDQMGNATCTEQPDTNGYYCYAPAVCGDGQCDDGEQDACPKDCAVCGDGQCNLAADEPSSCAIDCCGDGFCDPGESSQSCPQDCP